MNEMFPRTPLPEVTFPAIPEPLEYERAAILWLVKKGFPISFALDNWESVELVYATVADPDYFWDGSRHYRVLNPQDFGVEHDFADTEPGMHSIPAEAWPIQPPDIDPGPAAEFAPLDEAPEPHVEPATSRERRCVWCAVTLGCVLFWAVAATVAISIWS